MSEKETLERKRAAGLIRWTLDHIAPKQEKPLIIYYDPETMRICDDGGETDD